MYDMEYEKLPAEPTIEELIERVRERHGAFKIGCGKKFIIMWKLDQIWETSGGFHDDLRSALVAALEE